MSEPTIPAAAPPVDDLATLLPPEVPLAEALLRPWTLAQLARIGDDLETLRCDADAHGLDLTTCWERFGAELPPALVGWLLRHAATLQRVLATTLDRPLETIGAWSHQELYPAVRLLFLVNDAFFAAISARIGAAVAAARAETPETQTASAG